MRVGDFPGGPVVKNSPAIPGLQENSTSHGATESVCHDY